MKQRLVIGNWKMNGSLADNMLWATNFRHQLKSDPLQGVEVSICPPFPYLYPMRQMLPSHIPLGSQDVSSECIGAFTGEVSINMLKELQCRYVIVGHSERRARMHESDAIIAQKFKLVTLAGLTPVLCVGETQQEREQGLTQTVISRQIQAVIDACGAHSLRGSVIAYEPVWAIGTGVSAHTGDIRSTHALIRAQLGTNDLTPGDVTLLYGGSLKPDNCREIFSLTNVDGGLIGGASLKADSFIEICQAAQLRPFGNENETAQKYYN